MDLRYRIFAGGSVIIEVLNNEESTYLIGDINKMDLTTDVYNGVHGSARYSFSAVSDFLNKKINNAYANKAFLAMT